MYLRHTTRRKDGKVHRYWRLVRSVRVGRKVVQQTVAQLGELDADGRARAKALARAITGDVEQPDLFRPAESDDAIAVRLNRIRLERGRTFGDVWLGWTLWRALRLDEVLERLVPTHREAVPWSTMAAVLVLARLCEPSSELHIAEDWYRGTALEDLLAVPAPLVNDDRLYRALDRLLPHKAELEQHLVARLGELFALNYDLLLYDVTSVYFEGRAARNPLAQRGHSRDHRPDCKQVCLALVVTREGMPVGYELFAGNRTDVTTVEQIVAQMEARFGAAQRIWVMDRGMTSADNVHWLRETGRRYLVGTPPRTTGARCATGSRPSSVSGPTATRRFCWSGPPSGGRKNAPCTTASRATSRRDSPGSAIASSMPSARWTCAAWNVSWAACSNATLGRPHGTPLSSSRTRRAPPACGWSGAHGRSGMTGPGGAKAVMSCGPT